MEHQFETKLEDGGSPIVEYNATIQQYHIIAIHSDS